MGGKGAAHSERVVREGRRDERHSATERAPGLFQAEQTASAKVLRYGGA